VVTVAARREVVAFIKTRHISERRGCRLVSLNRKSCRYRKRRQADNELIKRLGELAIEHPRFGYRRIHALLGRESFKINLKRVHRLWKQEKLSLPSRRRRKARAKTTVGIVPKAETRVRKILQRVCLEKGFPELIRSKKRLRVYQQSSRRVVNTKRDRAVIYRSRQSVAKRQG
jgi:transposase InsO family protein